MLSNFLLPFIILVCGTYILIKLRFFFILHPICTFKLAFQGENTKDAVQSLLLALAGTLGVGNIIGVAFGIAGGGAGSVFWLVFSALFAAALKYAEVFVTANSDKKIGMIGVIRSLFGRWGKALSIAYAAICLLLSFFMGSIFQGAAVRNALSGRSEGFILSCAILLSMLAALVCLDKKSGIKKATSVIIPLAVILYSFLCFSVIVRYRARIPTVIYEIFKGAFSLRSAAFGTGGFALSSAIREGFARGLLSNEAGAGTSSFSHTALDKNECERAGVFGIIEALFDTVIICPMTAFAILTSGTEGLSITIPFKSVLGNFGEAGLFVSITAFSFSTIICWYFYGSVCREYIFGERFIGCYFFLFFISFAIGIFNPPKRLIEFTDTILLLLTILSSASLLLSSEKIVPPNFKDQKREKKDKKRIKKRS